MSTETATKPRGIKLPRRVGGFPLANVVANAVQNTFLIMFLAGAYFWQKGKEKRTGAKGPQDPVKGYMPGK